MMADLGLDERIFLAALALYVTVLPISGTTALRGIAFALLVGVTAWRALAGRLRLELPLVGTWAAYAAVALASLFYAVDPGYSLGEIKIEIGYCFIVFAIAASWIRSPRDLQRLLWLLVGGNLLFVGGSAWTALQGKTNLLGSWDTGVGSTATVIVTVLPWIVALAADALARRRHWTTGFLAALGLADLGALALTMNRQSWIALAVSAAVAAALAGRTFWTKRRTLAAGVLAVLFLALFAFQFQARAKRLIGPGAPSALESSARVVDHDPRWEGWRFSLDRIADKPWSGGGFGREAFNLQFPDFHRTHALLWHAHNMVLNKGIQMGIPGVASFLALWLALAAACARGLGVPSLRPWAVATLAMIAGVFVRNQADDLFVRDHALLFWLLCGAYLGALRQALQAEGQRA